VGLEPTAPFSCAKRNRRDFARKVSGQGRKPRGRERRSDTPSPVGLLMQQRDVRGTPRRAAEVLSAANVVSVGRYGVASDRPAPRPCHEQHGRGNRHSDLVSFTPHTICLLVSLSSAQKRLRACDTRSDPHRANQKVCAIRVEDVRKQHQQEVNRSSMSISDRPRKINENPPPTATANEERPKRPRQSVPRSPRVRNEEGLGDGKETPRSPCPRSFS